MLSNDPQISIAVGIVIGLLASFVQSLGLTIQRKSHILNQAQPEHARRADYKRPLWLLGFTVFILSNILGSVFQIAALPIVILAPLGAVSLLWNAFFARLLLGDVFNKFMLIGTLFVIAGAVLIGIFGIVPEPTHSLEDLLLLFGRKSFIVYFSLLGAALVSILAITHITEWSYNRRRIILITPVNSPPLSPLRSPIVLTSSPGLEDGFTEDTPLLDPKFSRSSSPLPVVSRTPTLLAISYASASGLLSGMCLLFAKSGVELLVLTASGKNQFWRWESWALVGGLIVFALLQLWYLHKSLVLEDPTLVCPLAFCFYNLSSILNGLIYFDQFDRLSGKQLGLVILGIFILLGGVWAVSHVEGDDNPGIQEGDWTITDPVDSPTSPTRERSGSYGTAIAGHSPNPARPPAHSVSRRAVSSPSALTISSSSEDDGMHDGESIPFRPRIHSASQTEAPPVSPTRIVSPRRQRTRRTSMLSPDGNSNMPPLGGFSIGLSPISPGFALVPSHRERGGTDLGGPVMEEPEPESSGELNGEAPTRRRWSTIRRALRFLPKRKEPAS